MLPGGPSNALAKHHRPPIEPCKGLPAAARLHATRLHLTDSRNRPDKAGMKAQPRLGCGAAILRDGRLLLMQRLRPPEALHWGLPGGKVDWFEPVAVAVAREVEEELAIRLRDLRLLCVVDQIDRAASEHWVAPVYTTSAFEGEPRLVEPDKAAALGWFALDRLTAPLTIATVTAVAALRRYEPGEHL